jgi:hypothetical protein
MIKSPLQPPEDVHYMIMTAKPSDKGWTISGDEETFDSLLSVISEEIGEGFCTQKNARALLGICKKVNPASLDWIGM